MNIVFLENPEAKADATSLMLWGQGHEVQSVSTSEEALTLVQEQDVRMVIVDWEQVDALAFCRELRNMRLSDHTYVLLIGNEDQRPSMVGAMLEGADDFMIRPFEESEMAARMTAVERMVLANQRLVDRNTQLTQVNRNLSSAYMAISKDVEAAARLQKSMLPTSVVNIGNIRFDWLFAPAAILAGDIFNFFRLGDDHIAFYHLDVAGHGVPSAMLSVMLSKLLSSESGYLCSVKGDMNENETPEAVVGSLNERFQVEEDAMQYFTMVYGVIERATGRVQMCQAGHPSPILVSKVSGSSQIGGGGFPVGMLPGVDFETVEFQLDPGDRLILYSDGITECQDPEGDFFGEDRLVNYLDHSSPLALENVMTGLESRLRDWKGDDQFDDDVSLLAIEMMAS